MSGTARKSAADRAGEPYASAWVSASAGTGKTHVLIQRLKRLLLAGTRPDSILCITYTNAAAAEMANRLNRDLGEWVTADDGHLAETLETLLGRAPTTEETGRARQLFAVVLDTPGGVKIQTIHSFCQSLLGRFPLEAGISPRFEALDERTAREFLAEATEQMLAATEGPRHARLGEAMQRIADEITEQGFDELRKAVIGNRGKLERFFEAATDAEDRQAAVLRALELPPDISDEKIVSLACDLPAEAEQILRRLARALEEGGKTNRELAAVMARWLEAGDDRAAFFEDYQNSFFTKGGAPRSLKPAKAAEAAEPDCAAWLEAEQARIVAIHEKRRLMRVAKATGAALELSAYLLGRYETAKRHHAVLDYDDLIFNTRHLLRDAVDAAWVLYKLDGGIDHVLIDEAQDTNPEQWDIVDAIVEEFFAGESAREETRTVFAVGDIKQSIYSFQGAAPEEFERYRNAYRRKSEEARLAFEDVEMHRSYRSTPAVLDLVDAVFAQSKARDGLVFDDGIIRHEPNRTGQAGRVELWPVVAQPESEDHGDGWTPATVNIPERQAPAELAAYIAARIKTWLEKGERLESRDRPLRAGDILILVQKRKPLLDPVVRALKEAGVPVAGADRMKLTEQIAINDLTALAHFTLLPDDSLTLAAVLKSPLIGLTEEQLFTLAHGRKGSLWRALRDAAREDDAFRAARDFLSRQLERADFAPPYEFFADLLSAEGGRAKLIARLGTEVNDPVDEFLNLALDYERSHVPSLQGFLHWLENTDDEIKRDQEQTRDEVQVMTVHGAKGLQAPVVILPDTCRWSYTPEKLLWLDPDPDLPRVPVWPVRSANLVGPLAAAAQRAELKSEREYHRLLYVALTRAQDRLYVAGWEKKTKEKVPTWYDLVAGAMKDLKPVEETPWDGPDCVGEPVIKRHSNPQEAQAMEKGTEEPLAEAGPLPDWARRAAPDEPTPPRPLAPSRPSGFEPAAISPLQSAAAGASRRGDLTHRLLEHLPELAPDRRRRAADDFLARHAPDLGEEDRAAIRDETLRVLDEPSLAPLFGPGSQAEVPIAGQAGAFTVTGQIDRLLVSDREIMIVDYKSNRAPPSDPDSVPEIYLRQLAAYSLILGKIYPGRPVRCALLWTETAALMEIDPAVLARYRPGDSAS